jgi:hypothetical protein
MKNQRRKHMNGAVPFGLKRLGKTKNAQATKRFPQIIIVSHIFRRHFQFDHTVFLSIPCVL